LHNIALLLCCWWKLYTDENTLWSKMINILYGVGHGSQGPYLWLKVGSFFWRNLLQIKHYFHCSTTWVIGNGKKITFWSDYWAGPPLNGLFTEYFWPTKSSVSLRDGAESLHTVLPHPRSQQSQYIAEELSGINFSTSEDMILWKWSSTGVHTSRSFYQAFAAAGKECTTYEWIWKAYVTPTAILLVNGRLLTWDMLARRNIPCTSECVMCMHCPHEITLHLFFQCPYASQVWSLLARQL
jgi:zinc-binding in reverse transcriptase